MKMHCTALLLVILLPLVGRSQSQKPEAGANTAPSAPERAPHSTKADLAVPLCPAKFNDSLKTNGIAAANDKSVTPPIAKNSVRAEFRGENSPPAGNYEVKLSFIVDIHGEPNELCLVRSAGYGLDAEAGNAANRYRFAPATKDGKPVPKRVFTDVHIQLH